MRRETSLFLTLGLLSTIAPPIFAQDLQGQPDPVPPSTVLVGPQLIAWSELQRPQPVQQPEQKLVEQRNQPSQKPTEPAAQSTQPHEDARNVSGNQTQNK